MGRKSIVLFAAILVIIAAANVVYVQSLPTTRELEVQAYDFFYTIQGLKDNNPAITVRTGDTIVLTLENRGSTDDHEFFVLTQSDFNAYMTALQNGQNVTEPKPAFTNGSVEDVQAGQSKTGIFVVGAAGTYIYACLDKESTNPVTHANKGMYGTFEVQGGGLPSLTRSLGESISNTFSTVLVSIPGIVVWQVVIALSLAAIAKRK